MKIRILSIFTALCLVLGLLCGCTVTAELPASGTETETAVHFNGDEVSITGSGAMLDGGEVVIAESGTYVLSGTSTNSRVIVKAADTADVTLVLDGLALANPLDEAIYFKTCGSAAVILKDGTENFLLSGELPQEDGEDDTLTITDEGEEASGAALRARCAMTLSGGGSLAVGGYINNGIAADGGLTVTGGTYDVYAVNDGVKSDGDVTVTGGTFTIQTECDGIQAGGTLDISGGDVTVATGSSAEGADMKVSDSLMMGMGGGGMGGGRDRRSSEEASAEAETGETASAADTAAASEEPAPAADTAAASEEPSAADAARAEQPSAPAENTANAEDAQASEESAETANTEKEDRSASREMTMPGGMDDAMDFWDSDSADTPSRKGLKATEAIVISGGVITVDAEDDAIHSDGSVTITGGTFTLSSGDDGVHGETVLDISGGEMDVLLCYEGLEAKAIYISGGYMNITATDDGMNAGGSSGEMMGQGMRPGSSQEASAEAEDTAAETEDAASGETAEAEAETVETVVRISGGTVIVNSGGDGLDSNASMYIEGGVIFVSGPSSNWDSPIDYGEGSSELVITGGFLMAAGYSGMFESPDVTDASQGSIYYVQSEYAPDNAVTTLKAADGTVLAEYAFAHSYNGVLISTPEIAAGETYTLTIDGIDTLIEMTTAQYSSRGSSGEMGGMGGMGGRR